MSQHKSYREESKSNWGTTDDGMTIEQIRLGCLLRIADASEKMASNYAILQNDRDYYKDAYNNAVGKSARLERKISSLKGVITKLKKKHEKHLRETASTPGQI